MSARKKPAKGNPLSNPSPKVKKAVARRTDTSPGRLEWWTLSTDELFQAAGDALRGLGEKADAGEDDALRALLNTTVYAIGRLEALQDDDTRARRIISSVAYWPILLRPKTGRKRGGKSREQAIAEIDSLGLGAACELNVLGKYDEDAPITKAVLKIYGLLTNLVRKSGKPGLLIIFNGIVSGQQQEAWREWVKANAQRLPNQLTRSNAPEWAKLTEPVLKIFWGEMYEQHADFAGYNSVKEWKAQKPGLPGSLTPGKVRDAIRKSWGESWESISNPSH